MMLWMEMERQNYVLWMEMGRKMDQGGVFQKRGQHPALVQGFDFGHKIYESILYK